VEIVRDLSKSHFVFSEGAGLVSEDMVDLAELLQQVRRFHLDKQNPKKSKYCETITVNIKLK